MAIPEKYVLLQQGYVDSIVTDEADFEVIIENPPNVEEIVLNLSRDIDNRTQLLELMEQEFPQVNPDVYLIM